MSRTESVEPPELLLPSRARRSVLVLPEDPSDDELLRHWTLSEADTREILRCRGDDNRRRQRVCCASLHQSPPAGASAPSRQRRPAPPGAGAHPPTRPA